ncbi:tRNA-intron endonuclease catalytic domain-like protein [Coemansia reversa NRRL 1564]|uniref:tRNA-intron lyase n=1 Tax=Coemansia reversa (strain ATCC 12441 / NRRL 1564) TaxID=763665 RepID=A0A2G5BF84_COERN|nr:tRNA-intron endonuclease catalytic domain-like protein [Coemansia reversa NRRL 1564]|eukprot:PIA17664.1 tRNA-intron endonuclease catalytic domain-like protein [Coemansia reversa NRRL 1564]
MLAETGVVEFEGDDFVWPESEHDRLRFALYKDLHRQGYYVDRGIKYGGDYLLYPGDPLRHHSSHVVTLLERKRPFKPRELVPLGRVGTAVKKARLLSSWNPETGQFSHITMNWSAM